MNSLVEDEINRWNWDDYRIINKSAGHLPKLIRGLLESQSPTEANAYYWEFENKVFVQECLFDSSVPVVSAFLVALENGIYPRWVLISVMEIIYAITKGKADSSEVVRGVGNIENVCRRIIENHWPCLEKLSAIDKTFAGDIEEMRHIIFDKGMPN